MIDFEKMKREIKSRKIGSFLLKCFLETRFLN